MQHPVLVQRTKLLSYRRQTRKYIFVVNVNFREPEIQTAIEKLCEVKVLSVTTNVLEIPVLRKKIFPGRYGFQKEEFKEAVITLAAGYSLNLEGFIEL